MERETTGHGDSPGGGCSEARRLPASASRHSRSRAAAMTTTARAAKQPRRAAAPRRARRAHPSGRRRLMSRRSTRAGSSTTARPARWASINPYKGLDSGLVWGFTILDPLFYTPAIPACARSSSAPQSSSRTATHYTIKLKDANFHNVAPVNGRAVKAADVKATYEAAARFEDRLQGRMVERHARQHRRRWTTRRSTSC